MAEILSSDGDFSSDVKQHIKNCRSCADWADSWQTLREVPLPTEPPVPASVDFAIRQAARKRSHWLLPKWFYAVATAACALIFSWLIITSHHYAAQKQQISNQELVAIFDSGIGLNSFFDTMPTDDDVNTVIDDVRAVDNANGYF